MTADDVLFYDAATERVALALTTWADQRRGQRLADLPSEDLAFGRGLAHGLQAVTQASYGGGYDDGTSTALEALADAVQHARDITSWGLDRTRAAVSDRGEAASP